MDLWYWSWSSWPIVMVCYTAQKMKFFVKDFFSKCNQIRRKLRIWSHLLKESLMENFIFCAVLVIETKQKFESVLMLCKHFTESCFITILFRTLLITLAPYDIKSNQISLLWLTTSNKYKELSIWNSWKPFHKQNLKVETVRGLDLFQLFLVVDLLYKFNVTLVIFIGQHPNTTKEGIKSAFILWFICSSFKNIF